ncbi:MAG: hypothetical protein HY361_04420 [Candidatus Aenigmarchaeota archaeon]|nr:hypothetical protein [Candidatus Aenigmarchaeota archaeon]
MAVLIPIWFYVFSSLTYVLAAVVGNLLTYFAFKLYNFTGKREQKFLAYAMGFITLGFIILSAANVYGYFNFQHCFPVCQFDVTDPNYTLVIKAGNYAYYFTSLIGYILLSMTYLKSIKIDKFFGIMPLNIAVFVQTLNNGFLYPFDNLVFQLFHLIAIVILAYINFNTITNYLVLKTKNSFPVMLGFLFIGSYHFLMALTPFKPIIFAAAHLSLLAGLVSLLWMLVQVNRRG